MYNTVGETAGVTQDVGSDPTVNFTLTSLLPDFCMLCGQEVLCFVCGEEECMGFVGRGKTKGYEDGGGEEEGGVEHDGGVRDCGGETEMIDVAMEDAEMGEVEMAKGISCSS